MDELFWKGLGKGLGDGLERFWGAVCPPQSHEL